MENLWLKFKPIPAINRCYLSLEKKNDPPNDEIGIAIKVSSRREKHKHGFPGKITKRNLDP